jgi:hypothetical protein
MYLGIVRDNWLTEEFANWAGSYSQLAGLTHMLVTHVFKMHFHCRLGLKLVSSFH